MEARLDGLIYNKNRRRLFQLSNGSLRGRRPIGWMDDRREEMVE